MINIEDFSNKYRPCDSFESCILIRAIQRGVKIEKPQLAYFSGGSLATYSNFERLLVHRYPIYKQAAPNFEIIEGSDEIVNKIKECGFNMKDSRKDYKQSSLKNK